MWLKTKQVLHMRLPTGTITPPLEREEPQLNFEWWQQTWWQCFPLLWQLTEWQWQWQPTKWQWQWLPLQWKPSQWQPTYLFEPLPKLLVDVWTVFLLKYINCEPLYIWNILLVVFDHADGYCKTNVITYLKFSEPDPCQNKKKVSINNRSVNIQYHSHELQMTLSRDCILIKKTLPSWITFELAAVSV